MKVFTKLIALTIILAGCASDGAKFSKNPVVGPWYSEFKTVDEDLAPRFGPFLQAMLAQHDYDHLGAAKHYLYLHQHNPNSRFVTERAFFQSLMAGRMDEASKLAGTLAESDAKGVEVDLAHLLTILDSFKKQKWAQVREEIKASPQGGFSHIFAPLLTAWSYAAEKNLGEVKYTLKALGDNPVLVNMGAEHYAYMLDYMGHTEEALKAYNEYVHSDKLISLQPVIAYASALTSAGRLQDARQLLSIMMKRFGNNAYLLREGLSVTKGNGPSRNVRSPLGGASFVLYRLASELSQSRSHEAAVIYVRIASFLTPSLTDHHLLLGSSLSEMKLHTAAAYAYAAVPTTDPMHSLAQDRMIRSLRAAGKSDEALNLILAKLRENPNNRHYLIMLGDMQREQQEFQTSLAYYDRAIAIGIEIGREDWFSYFARGVSYEQMDKLALAEADFLNALRLNPTEPNVLNYLGYSWIDQGKNFKQAHQMILKAVKARPEDGFILDSLGWAYYVTGDYENAVKNLEQAVKYEPTDPTINQHLGDAYWRVGRHIEARFQWRHALDGALEPTERILVENKLEFGLSTKKNVSQKVNGSIKPQSLNKS